MNFYGQYKYKFYLNATHAINIDGVKGDIHPHTWEIILDTVKVIDAFVQFDEVESKIDGCLEKYQNKLLNEIEPFNDLNPTLEYMTNYLLEEFQSILNPIGWFVFMIEIAETPTRSYIISTVENQCIKSLMQKNQSAKIIEEAFSKEHV